MCIYISHLTSTSTSPATSRSPATRSSSRCLTRRAASRAASWLTCGCTTAGGCEAAPGWGYPSRGCTLCTLADRYSSSRWKATATWLQVPTLGSAPPGQCPSSAPAPPQGAPGGPGRLDTPMGKRPRHRAPSHRLGCLSELPPNLADLTAFFSPTRLRHRCLCHVQPSGRRQLGALPRRAHRGRRRGWLRAIGGARQCSPSDEARAGPSRRAVMRACGGRVCACTCMTHLCHVHVTAGRGQQWQYRVYYFLLVPNKQKSGLLFLSSFCACALWDECMQGE